MAFNDEIKALMDASVDQPTEVQVANVEKCVDNIYHYIINGYQQSRECIQFAMGQLDRIHLVAVVKMILMAMETIDGIANKFTKVPSPSLSYFDENIDENLYIQLLNKISPFIGGMQNMANLNIGIAQSLTLEERQKMVGFCVQMVQHLGLKTKWNEDDIMNHSLMQMIMYSICKKDGVMDFFFNWNNNVSDRLNTSSQYQLARNFAESLLMIGHQEGMIAEAYYDASRAYTGGKHVLAGVLYMNLALLDLKMRNSVRQEMAFDIIWQMLKIMREAKYYDQAQIDELLQMYDGLGMDDYKTLSIYHTAFGVSMFSGVEETARRIEAFLSEKRDILYNHMEHSAAPWYSLIRTIRQNGAKGDYPVMNSFEEMMKVVLLNNGNQDLVNFYDEKTDKSALLIEELAKIETAHNPEDIGNDSYKALLMAKDVLDKAAVDENVENFILAMRPKADFSFAMIERKTDVFKKLEVVDAKGGEFKLRYGDVDNLAWLFQVEKSDCVMWIGRGNEGIHRMTLISNMYDFDRLQELEKLDIEKLQKEIISHFVYSRTGRDNSGTIYEKENIELKQEADQIFKQMDGCQLPVPGVVNRLFFVKDMELAAIPHQLLIDERTGTFIGEEWPTANVISTEFLIKSNFNDPLPKGYTKSYWSPLNKEGTFIGIKDGISKILDDYHFNVDDNDEPAVPLHSDLNIVCAHGADNISNTEWFYAGGEPIVNTKKVVGHGKILILFVCHSGSITYQHYDHAMHTIVKRYLRMGYSSVVAPMWSLNWEILPTWLDIFMRVIDEGGYVVDAVFKANMVVKGQYITPSAWACLHLYGNPYMKIAEKPILWVEEGTDDN